MKRVWLMFLVVHIILALFDFSWSRFLPRLHLSGVIYMVLDRTNKSLRFSSAQGQSMGVRQIRITVRAHPAIPRHGSRLDRTTRTIKKDALKIDASSARGGRTLSPYPHSVSTGCAEFPVHAPLWWLPLLVVRGMLARCGRCFPATC